MTDVVKVFNGEVRCLLCGFYATADGAVDQGEIEAMVLEIDRMHGRQRHGEMTSSAVSTDTYEQPTAPTDVDGRPERQN